MLNLWKRCSDSKTRRSCFVRFVRRAIRIDFRVSACVPEHSMLPLDSDSRKRLFRPAEPVLRICYIRCSYKTCILRPALSLLPCQFGPHGNALADTVFFPCFITYPE
jgi:hypothetical protein